MDTPIYKELKSKTVVISGGAGILGKCLGKAFAAQGAKVVLVDKDKEWTEKAVNEITEEAGGKVSGVRADVLDLKSLEAARDEINKSAGGCDILINTVGGMYPEANTSFKQFEPGDLEIQDIKTFFNIDLKDIKYAMDLNFIGSLLPAQVFSKDMINKEGCSVINISSLNSYRPLTRVPIYSSAKAALSNFTMWLSVHFGKIGVRVNAVAPGFFLTDQNKSFLTNKYGDLTERGRTIIELTPMERFGEPEEINGTILWLCSKQSSFITGAIIPVDGGFNAYSGV